MNVYVCPRTRAALALALCSLALAAPASAAEEQAAAPKANLLPDLPASEKACTVCHTEPLFPVVAFEKSVHKKLGCAECHQGFDFSSHRSELAELSEDEQARVDKLKAKSTAPRALLACQTCHSDEVEELEKSIHGRWLKEERPVAGPWCLDCHGSPHAIIKTRGAAEKQNPMGVREERIHARSRRCVECHGDPKLTEAVGLPGYEASAYHDSLHGRMVQLGQLQAPNCADCHGSHSVLSPTNPASTVYGENRVQICAKCHANANPTFASLVTHKPLAEQKLPHLIHAFFSWLTTLTLLGLFLHILLDAGTEIRHRILVAHGQKDEIIPASLPRAVSRFDIHQRIQHWLLISSVVLLVLTGWPVRSATLGPAQSLATALGGPMTTALIHRVAAVLLIAAAVYHIVYLVVLAQRRQMVFSMVPVPKDLKDMYGNILYFFGLRKTKPRFGRFSYIEKFDYWAVFWGVAIMVGSGFIYWFPAQFAAKLPAWLIVGAQLAHGEEATLAALALFVWHFYNVHLRPSVFPMSWTWLDGKIPIESLHEEHMLEYEKLLDEHKAAGKGTTGGAK